MKVHVRGGERSWRVLSAAALVIASGSLLISVLLYSRAGEDAVAACQRSVEVRQALNNRIPLHEADARNLARLTRLLAEKNESQAAAILTIARKFRVGDRLDDYSAMIERAGEQARVILDDASRIRFDPVPIPNCDAVVKSG